MIKEKVSIPFSPLTPGLKVATLEKPGSKALIDATCEVTIILETTLGPKESGVEFLFPKPTIKYFL